MKRKVNYRKDGDHKNLFSKRKVGHNFNDMLFLEKGEKVVEEIHGKLTCMSKQGKKNLLTDPKKKKQKVQRKQNYELNLKKGPQGQM